jgi:hypothetical protein
MGYRSDVAYVITFKPTDNGKALFYIFLTEAKSREEMAFCFDDGLVVNDEKMIMSFQTQCVKWYSDFNDVKCHAKLLDLAEEYVAQESIRSEKANEEMREKFKAEYGKSVNDMGFAEIEERGVKIPEWQDEDLGFSFVRIGENDDDSETRWGGWHDAIHRCQLSRVIDVDLN